MARIGAGGGNIGGGTAGPRGPQGEPGKSLTFKSAVATFSALPAGVEDDARIVLDEGNIYVHNGTTWIDGGQFQGPEGATGATGPTGPTGIQGDAGAHNAHLTVTTVVDNQGASTYFAGSADAGDGTGVGAYIEANAVGSITSLGGATITVGSRVVFSGRTNPIENGIYTVSTTGSPSTKLRLVRATDFDNHIPGQVEYGDFVLVTEGTYAGRTLIQFNEGTGTNNYIRIGIDPINFTTTGGVGPVGATGASGSRGATGPTGPSGSRGATGASGNDGNDGLGYILSTYAESASSAWSTGSSKRFRTTVAPNTTAFVVGTRVRITRTTNNYVEGVITALDNDSGSTGGTGYGITLTIDTVVGTSGSTSCTVSVTGDQGADGATGPSGPSGAAGSSVSWVTAPTNYNSTGTVGQFAYSNSGATDYLYACIATNRWIRITSTNISSNFTSGGGG